MNAPQPELLRLRAKGVDFTALACGCGPLVLCLHGFPDTAYSFVPLLQSLAVAGSRAVAPFMRGYFPSGLAPDGDYRAQTLGADVLALIEALGEREADLVGHDWGSVAAQFAALQKPAAVRRLVLMAVSHIGHFLQRLPSAQFWRSRYMLYFQLRGLPERELVREDFAALRALIHRWSPGWAMTETDFAPLREAFSKPASLGAALAYYRALPRQLASTQTWRWLRQPLRSPTLMLHGAQDGCIGPEVFPGQEARFAAGYQRHCLPQAGHFLQCEQPEEVSRRVLAFLQAPTFTP